MQDIWKLIVNPTAGNGKGNRLAKPVEQCFRDMGIPFESEMSRTRGELILIARHAYLKGYRKFAMLGGDGTANEIINGIAQAANPERNGHTGATLSMIGIGTGNDWMKTLKLPSAYKDSVGLLKAPVTRKHDLGRVCFPDGRIRYFLNIAGLGFDGEVTRKVADRKGFLAGSKLSYWLAILQAIFTYKHTQVLLRSGDQVIKGKTLTAAIGICKFNGGGMMQLPEAEFDDGQLDVTLIGEMSKFDMVRHLPKMLDGSFTHIDAVHTARSPLIRVKSNPAVWVEADGEVLGRTPVEIDQLNRVVDVVVPA